MFVRFQAIKQDSLDGDEAGISRAQERIGCAELVRISEELGRMTDFRRATASSSEIPSFFPVDSWLERRRSVSNWPGNLKIDDDIVLRDRARNSTKDSVRPARAPDDKSGPSHGIFTASCRSAIYPGSRRPHTLERPFST
jgi:hypothetical protein